MPDDEVTLGELARNIYAMENRFNAQFSTIKTEVKTEISEVNRRLDRLQFVHRETYDAEMRAIKEDVDDLKDSRKWMSRFLTGAFLIAFAAPIFVALVVSR